MSADIDFEHEGSPVAGSCEICRQPLRGEYWEANGRVACATCKDTVDAMGSAGTPFSRATMALALGVGAMALGAVTWWAVARFANLQAALIAIGIGWLVGTGVRMGSQGRGGLGYQLLAVGLTWLSIVLAHVMLIAGELSGADAEELGLMKWPVIVMTAIVAPFLGGLGSILSIIIMGVGLVTAWQKNRRFAVAWSGPHAVGGGPRSATLPPLPGAASSPAFPPPLPPPAADPPRSGPNDGHGS